MVTRPQAAAALLHILLHEGQACRGRGQAWWQAWHIRLGDARRGVLQQAAGGAILQGRKSGEEPSTVADRTRSSCKQPRNTHPGDKHAARLPAQAAKCGPVRGKPSVHIPNHASWMQSKRSAHEMAEERTCLPMVGRSSTTPRTSSSPTTSNTTEPGGARRICRQRG